MQRDDNSVKDVIKNWALTSKAHGIANIARNQHYSLRLIWILCFLGSLGYCVYQIVITVVVFLKYEVTTTYSDVPEAPTLFPAVAFCNLNPYIFWLYSDYLIGFFNIFCQMIYTYLPRFDGNVASSEIDAVLNERNFSISNYDTVIDYLDAVTNQFKSTFNAEAENGTFNLYYNGFYIQQMFLSCKFQDVACSIDDFSYFYDYNYGNCYRFNGGINMSNQSVPIKKLKQAGWSNGLRLELYTGDPVQQQQYIFKSGMRVVVHNQSVIPFPDEDGIDVATGRQTNIAVARTFIERLAEPYNDCIEELDENTSKRNEILASLDEKYRLKTYTQKYCLKVCYQNYIIQKCGCFDYSSPYTNETLTDYNGCYTLDQVACVDANQTEFYNSDAIDKCYAQCPIECNSIQYDLKVTFAKYPSYWYADKLVNNTAIQSLYYTRSPTIDGFDDTLLMINVYYDEMMYTKIEEEPAMTFDLLIAYVGGNLGLFLGVSLMTLVESLEILFYIGYLVAKKTKKPNRTDITMHPTA